MRFFYSFFILLYRFVITLAAPFNAKASLWIRGRKDIFSTLQLQIPKIKKIIWIHCASLGEFEQGKPLIEKLKIEKPDHFIWITFFSPSGYEIRKNDPCADLVTYLPIDTQHNAKKLLSIVKPEMVLFIKYEYWFNLIQQLTVHHIPYYYVSAIFQPSHYFFKWYGRWFKEQLYSCSYFFVQNQESKTLLQNNGIHRVVVAGDTRFERVNSIAKQNCTLSFVEQFVKNNPLIVAGSTWAPDEKLLYALARSLDSSYKFIIAPHITDLHHIEQLKQLFSREKTVCYSEIAAHTNLAVYRIIIIDTIGLLSKIYRYSTYSYIGGAFKTGLHNTLEAAVFGVPLFFGPRYHKFNEAVEMVNMQAAFPINNYNEMKDYIMHFHNHPSDYRAICKKGEEYVQSNLGACNTIINTILHNGENGNEQQS